MQEADEVYLKKNPARQGNVVEVIREGGKTLYAVAWYGSSRKPTRHTAAELALVPQGRVTNVISGPTTGQHIIQAHTIHGGVNQDDRRRDR